jgi:Fe-S cluster assembly protein SufD
MIYADDVACAHGNTAGGLDEGALFYLRSRGVPAAEARALLIEAFLLEAVPDWMPPDVYEDVVGRIGAWLRSAP